MDFDVLPDRYEVALPVDDVASAARHYTLVTGGPPAARLPQAAWFDVPGTALRLAVRRFETPGTARVRACLASSHLRAITARLARARATYVSCGLSHNGLPRAITVTDVAGNRLELCVPPSERADVPRRRWAALRRLIVDRNLGARFARARELDERLRHRTF
jgi:hypothetical protein